MNSREIKKRLPENSSNMDIKRLNLGSAKFPLVEKQTDHNISKSGIGSYSM